MTEDQWAEIEDRLVEALGIGAFEAFAEAAGVILKRELLERGLGGADPASLDADFAGQMLISAWSEAAVQCFPDKDPADIVEHLAWIVDSAREEDTPVISSQRH